MSKTEIAKIFSAKIDELGVRQCVVAKKIGVTEDRLSRVLNNKNNMLADEFLALCVALDVSPEIFRENVSLQQAS